MKKLILFLTILAYYAAGYAQPPVLSDSSYIALLTCSPGEEVYALYGHSALRVKDMKNNFDYAFNYGVFDFNKPNFIYRFTKGETDYILGVSETWAFLEQYRERGSGVVEQILNLTDEEKQKIWSALLENSLPQYREYRYNFLYDNCSTRPRVIVEKYVSGKIHYPDILPETTFRKLIHHCNRNNRLLTFGIDLALGAPIDKPIDREMQLFLPEKLMTVFADAKIADTAGVYRNLIIETVQLVPEVPIKEEPRDGNPLLIAWLFFGVILILSIIELLKKKHFRWVDVILFFIIGLAGCLLVFLMFISVHPGVCPNYSFIWAHPLHLLLVLLLLIRSLRKIAAYYMGINAIILFLFMCCWSFFPQDFNPAFFPIVLTMFVRSGVVCFLNAKVLRSKGARITRISQI